MNDPILSRTLAPRPGQKTGLGAVSLTPTGGTTTQVLIGTGALFAGGAVGAVVGGKQHRIAGLLIGALGGAVLGGTAVALGLGEDKKAA